MKSSVTVSGFASDRVVVGDFDAELADACQLARVGADRAVAVRFDRADDFVRRIARRQRDQQPAHPTRCSSHD